MIDLQIQAVPNQKFSITINQIAFDVSLKTTTFTIADITIDGELKIEGVKCLPNTPIIPYQYLESGNFFFVIDGEDLPTYAEFGISQTLVYLDADEMAAYYGQ